jgi:hypothetical protein
MNNKVIENIFIRRESKDGVQAPDWFVRTVAPALAATKEKKMDKQKGVVLGLAENVEIRS